MMKKYNVEKVLYFANGDKGIHVSPSEKKKNTDLHQIVTKLLKIGHIVKAAKDDSGSYYVTTASGKIELLVQQINWRERNGKCAKEHKEELNRLTSA